MVVDATGGRPVVDLLRRAIYMGWFAGCGGHRRQDGILRGRLLPDTQTELILCCNPCSGGRVADRVPAERQAGTHPRMEQMHVRMTRGGREQFGAWRAGEHDDLVFAVALACWGARKILRRPPCFTLFGMAA